jgi:hypothetical protein
MKQPLYYLLERLRPERQTQLHPPFPGTEGCMTTGDTVEEAVKRFPMPCTPGWNPLSSWAVHTQTLKSRRYNGKIVLRMPPSLHESLMVKATEQGVSLNQLPGRLSGPQSRVLNRVQISAGIGITFEYRQAESYNSYVRDEKSRLNSLLLTRLLLTVSFFALVCLSYTCHAPYV